MSFVPVDKAQHSFSFDVNYLLEGFWNENGDPRSAGFPFMSSARVPATILTAYLLFVLWLGPKWMTGRKAFQLRKILLVYNVILASYNGYIFIRLLLNPSHLIERILDTRYPPVDDTSEWTLGVIADIYVYAFSKYIDLLDTVFFVLRKKNEQVTGGWI